MWFTFQCILRHHGTAAVSLVESLIISPAKVHARQLYVDSRCIRCVSSFQTNYVVQHGHRKLMRSSLMKYCLASVLWSPRLSFLPHFLIAYTIERGMDVDGHRTFSMLPHGS